MTEGPAAKTSVTVDLPAAAVARLDAWIAAQPEPRPSRAEAIRRLVQTGLAAAGVGAPGEGGSIALEDLNASNDE